MNRHKLFVFTALVLVLLVGVLAVEAGSQKIPPSKPVTFTYRWVQTLQPGKLWLDEEGTHIRDRVDLVKLEGDVAGTAVVVYNADVSGKIDPTQYEPVRPILTGDGRAYGTIAISEGNQEKPAPDWTGDWFHTIENGRVVAGGMTAFSLDKYWMMQITSVTESDKQALVYKGTIEYNSCLELPCDSELD